ncbi:YSC84-related protein [Hyphococcus flavus]|uniref:YSC84-related protein n=1 Tax=Hyphococcus flavus TaxID=1866326 RepID=A0AAE9ZCI5_9PROT|nr:YSC84-related protein [Hyphococcus flavus]WDI32319.1 YSC84-related protein [Hyphococcus flavus]
MKIVRLFSPLVALGLAFSVVQGAALAASKEKIDRRSDEALAEFRDEISGADDVLAKAAGVLVFPSVKKAGIGIGGEYGEGALRVGGNSVAYYSTASASIGFQLGAQARTQIIAFLDPKALEKFRLSDGWEVGVDASVAVITLGAGGAIDATQINQPIVAFVFDSKGLMYNLSLEGSKISQIHDD